MKIIEEAVAKGQKSLSEFSSKQVLASYGIPVCQEALVQSEEEAVEKARAFGFPVVLKGCGEKLTHKTEGNLIRLWLRGPEEVLEAGECDGVTGMAAFWKIKLPLILPSIGIISILTFVGNFNAFDLIYTAQGALAGPAFSTDILGTFMFRTFFGFQLQLADPHMGSAIASAMFFIILIGVCFYLFAIQTRLRRYQF